ncbi:hypothetical protein PtrM4_015770 [Pyrenophora tritici-repentis]|uniref:Uncharacterized protein n=1 Tax=Pyrenophora tritici-repentis TaxID=45151 RepID=A0A834SCI9_9PLEO|nr:hypothetical protein PtrM4_015770 [Pyrenophora tritici-repentis]
MHLVLVGLVVGFRSLLKRRSDSSEVYLRYPATPNSSGMLCAAVESTGRAIAEYPRTIGALKISDRHHWDDHVHVQKSTTSSAEM